MTSPTIDQAPLEAVLKDEIIRMYQEVADKPESTFHFYHGREAAELFGMRPNGSTAHRLVRSPHSQGWAIRTAGATCSLVRLFWTWAVVPDWMH